MNHWPPQAASTIKCFLSPFFHQTSCNSLSCHPQSRSTRALVILGHMLRQYDEPRSPISPYSSSDSESDSTCCPGQFSDSRTVCHNGFAHRAWGACSSVNIRASVSWSAGLAVNHGTASLPHLWGIDGQSRRKKIELTLLECSNCLGLITITKHRVQFEHMEHG